MASKMYLTSKRKRLFLALGLAFAPFLIIVIVGMGFDIIDEGVSIIGIGGLGSALFGILDFLLYLVLDTNSNDSETSTFFKNLLFYAIMVVEFFVALLVIISHVSDGNDILSDLSQYGGVGGLAFMGLVTFSWLLKFFAYLRIANGKFLPREALPYISVGSMIVGYLVALVISLVGLSSQFVIQWIPFILFMVCAVILFVMMFKNGAIFNDYDPYSIASSSSNAYFVSKPTGRKSTGSKSSATKATAKNYGKSYLTHDGAHGYIYLQMVNYFETLKKERYPSSKYIDMARLNYSCDVESNKYVVTWEIEITIFRPQWAKGDPNLTRDCQVLMEKIDEESKSHMEKMMKIVEQAIVKMDPSYEGDYGVRAPKISCRFA